MGDDLIRVSLKNKRNKPRNGARGERGWRGVDVDRAGLGRLQAAVESRNRWPAHTSGVTGDVGGCVSLCVRRCTAR